MTLETKTSKLSVWIEGNKVGETIVLLHGGPGVPDYLQPVASILNSTFQTIRFDQRGVGASSATEETYDLEGYVSDLDAIVKTVDDRPIHLFGHSWGGLLAQIYAASRPEMIRSLFLSSPSSGTGVVWKQMEREVVAYNRRQATSIEWLDTACRVIPSRQRPVPGGVA
jgi:proline iminopeptidase